MSPSTRRNPGASGCRRWTRPLAVLALACSGGAFAQVVSVPAAHLNHTEGSVAYAPQGDNEWHDVQPRRVLKRGDRLWTDRGSRAEVQAGGHALRLDGQTQIVLENVSDTATQLSLTQGSVAATVTRVNPGDTFEIGTPNLAFRAKQPGDYRIDADPKKGITRVVVLSGSAVVYGENGEALEVRNGQRLVFRNRDLAPVHTPAFAAVDDFDRWAAARRRGEPTVPMPALAAAPAQPPLPKGPVRTGPTIVIPGDGPAPAGRGALATAKLPPAKAAAALAAAQPAAKLAPAAALTLPAATETRPVMAPPAKSLAAAVPPAAAAAAPLRVSAPDTPPAQHVEAAVLPAQAPAALQERAGAAARAQAQAEAAAAQAAAAKAQAAREEARQQARAQARQAERERIAQQRAERAERAEREKRAALEARRDQDRKRAALAARRAEDEHRQAQARHEQEQKRLALKRAGEERRQALARRAAEEKDRKLAAARRAAEEQKLAAARKAEELRLAESRRRQLARLQEQAAREEQAAQARREQQARRAEEDREKREELARREEADRRQRALIEQARRDQERRDEEVWLRQQQLVDPPPMRPVPMGVPFVRRVS